MFSGMPFTQTLRRILEGEFLMSLPFGASREAGRLSSEWFYIMPIPFHQAAGEVEHCCDQQIENCCISEGPSKALIY
jgi:hypothetical protein